MSRTEIAKIAVPDSKLMDDDTLRKHLDLRHPGMRRSSQDRQPHGLDHYLHGDVLDHIHTAGDMPYNSKHPDYERNHARVIRLRGNAKEYQCLLCSDLAHDWIWLWRTHPDPYDPWSYEAMCRQDHIDYDDKSSQARKQLERQWADPVYRARMSGRPAHPVVPGYKPRLSANERRLAAQKGGLR
jgi:hypothetical protein